MPKNGGDDTKTYVFLKTADQAQPWNNDTRILVSKLQVAPGKATQIPKPLDLLDGTEKILSESDIVVAQQELVNLKNDKPLEEDYISKPEETDYPKAFGILEDKKEARKRKFKLNEQLSDLKSELEEVDDEIVNLGKDITECKSFISEGNQILEKIKANTTLTSPQQETISAVNINISKSKLRLQEANSKLRKESSKRTRLNRNITKINKRITSNNNLINLGNQTSEESNSNNENSDEVNVINSDIEDYNKYINHLTNHNNYIANKASLKSHREKVKIKEDDIDKLMANFHCQSNLIKKIMKCIRSNISKEIDAEIFAKMPAEDQYALTPFELMSLIMNWADQKCSHAHEQCLNRVINMKQKSKESVLDYTRRFLYAIEGEHITRIAYRYQMLIKHLNNLHKAGLINKADYDKIIALNKEIKEDIKSQKLHNPLKRRKDNNTGKIADLLFDDDADADYFADDSNRRSTMNSTRIRKSTSNFRNISNLSDFISTVPHHNNILIKDHLQYLVSDYVMPMEELLRTSVLQIIGILMSRVATGRSFSHYLILPDTNQPDCDLDCINVKKLVKKPAVSILNFMLIANLSFDTIAMAYLNGITDEAVLPMVMAMKDSSYEDNNGFKCNIECMHLAYIIEQFQKVLIDLNVWSVESIPANAKKAIAKKHPKQCNLLTTKAHKAEMAVYKADISTLKSTIQSLNSNNSHGNRGNRGNGGNGGNCKSRENKQDTSRRNLYKKGNNFSNVQKFISVMRSICQTLDGKCSRCGQTHQERSNKCPNLPKNNSCSHCGSKLHLSEMCFCQRLNAEYKKKAANGAHCPFSKAGLKCPIGGEKCPFTCVTFPSNDVIKTESVISPNGTRKGTRKKAVTFVADFDRGEASLQTSNVADTPSDKTIDAFIADNTDCMASMSDKHLNCFRAEINTYSIDKIIRTSDIELFASLSSKNKVTRLFDTCAAESVTGNIDVLNMEEYHKPNPQDLSYQRCGGPPAIIGVRGVATLIDGISSTKDGLYKNVQYSSEIPKHILLISAKRWAEQLKCRFMQDENILYALPNDATLVSECIPIGKATDARGIYTIDDDIDLSNINKKDESIVQNNQSRPSPRENAVYLMENILSTLVTDENIHHIEAYPALASRFIKQNKQRRSWIPLSSRRKSNMSKSEQAELAHKMLGHPGAEKFLKLQNSGAYKPYGITPYMFSRADVLSFVCDGCGKGKHAKTTKIHHSFSRNLYNKLLLTVIFIGSMGLYGDTAGPFRVPSLRGELYSFHVVCPATKYWWIYLMKTKDEAEDCTQKVIDEVLMINQQRLHKRIPPKFFCFDMCKEGLRASNRKKCHEKGVPLINNGPYNSDSQGPVESQIGATYKATRVDCIDNNIPLNLAPEILLRKADDHNLFPLDSQGNTPYSNAYGHPPKPSLVARQMVPAGTIGIVHVSPNAKVIPPNKTKDDLTEEEYKALKSGINKLHCTGEEVFVLRPEKDALNYLCYNFQRRRLTHEIHIQMIYGLGKDHSYMTKQFAYLPFRRSGLEEDEKGNPLGFVYLPNDSVYHSTHNYPLVAFEDTPGYVSRLTEAERAALLSQSKSDVQMDTGICNENRAQSILDGHINGFRSASTQMHPADSLDIDKLLMPYTNPNIKSGIVKHPSGLQPRISTFVSIPSKDGGKPKLSSTNLKVINFNATMPVITRNAIIIQKYYRRYHYRNICHIIRKKRHPNVQFGTLQMRPDLKQRQIKCREGCPIAQFKHVRKSTDLNTSNIAKSKAYELFFKLLSTKHPHIDQRILLDQLDKMVRSGTFPEVPIDVIRACEVVYPTSKTLQQAIDTQFMEESLNESTPNHEAMEESLLNESTLNRKAMEESIFKPVRSKKARTKRDKLANLRRSPRLNNLGRSESGKSNRLRKQTSSTFMSELAKVQVHHNSDTNFEAYHSICTEYDAQTKLIDKLFDINAQVNQHTPNADLTDSIEDAINAVYATELQKAEDRNGISYADTQKARYLDYSEIDRRQHRTPVFERDFNSMSDIERSYWLIAKDDEGKGMQYNGVFKLDYHADSYKRLLGTKWVYKTKFKDDSTIERFKARMTILGNLQRIDLDYKETFSPVSRFASLRALFAFGAYNGFNKLIQDVSQAFLLPEMDVSINVKIPKEFGIEVLLELAKDNPEHLEILKRDGFQRSHWSFKLLKSCYGCKQSSMLWYKMLSGWLVSQGWKPTEMDQCVFIYDHDGVKMYCAIYVDDLFIIHDKNDTKAAEAHVKAFRAKFTSTVEYGSEAKMFVGMTIRSGDDNSWILTQENFINKMVKDFEIEMKGSIKEYELPHLPNVRLDKFDPKLDVQYTDNKISYREAVGKLTWLSNTCRPDIAYATLALQQHLNHQTEKHFKALMRVLGYLKRTAKLGLVYGRKCNEYRSVNGTQRLYLGTPGVYIEIYSDANFAGDVNPKKYKSVMGAAIFMWGSLVKWMSRRTAIVCLSSFESELYALTESARDAMWARDVYKNITGNIHQPVPIYEDNMAAQLNAARECNHRASRHIGVRIGFLREAVQHQVVDVSRVNSKENIADFFTKPLDGPTFFKHRKFFMNFH